MQFGNLTLGTAAFGMPYGVANPPVPVSALEVDEILDMAWGAGVQCVDTAPAYGEAERRLGEWMQKRQRRLTVISKMPSLKLIGRAVDTEDITRFVDKSCKALGIDRVDGYLAHHAGDLQQPGVAQAMLSLQQSGRIGAFGASVYTVEEAEAALGIQGLRLLQVPINLIDHRFVDSGLLARCRDAGVIVFARSVFLQGAFFMNRANVPNALSSLSETLTAIGNLAKKSGCGIAALAFAFVRDTPGITSSVMGVYDVQQLRELLACRAASPLSAEIVAAIDALALTVPDAAIDPRNWSS